jgi:hypothetical protein
MLDLSPALLLLPLLFVVYVPCLVYWLVKPLNYENVSLERFLALGGFFLLTITLMMVMSLAP